MTQPDRENQPVTPSLPNATPFSHPGDIDGRQAVQRDIIVIGASAGGVEALERFVSRLEPDTRAAFFVVMHFPAYSVSVLPQILARKGPLPARHAVDGQPVRYGEITIAPPNFHLEFQDGKVNLGSGPRVNGVRPAIDIMFRSAAQAYGSRVIGIILSGTLGDGVAGLVTIRENGGLTIVQDPTEASFASLPENAINNAPIDYVLPLADIAAYIKNFSRPAQSQGQVGDRLMVDDNPQAQEPFIREDIRQFEEGHVTVGSKTTITCPDCGGMLWEDRKGNRVHYHCHLGHAYSEESVYLAQGERLERALWSAVRVMEERASLSRRMGSKARTDGRPIVADYFDNRARQAEEAAAVITRLLGNDQLGRSFHGS